VTESENGALVIEVRVACIELGKLTKQGHSRAMTLPWPNRTGQKTDARNELSTLWRWGEADGQFCLPAQKA